MEDSNKKSKVSRRDFLEAGVGGAAGIAIGLAAGSLLQPSPDSGQETIRMLTANGQLVEINKRLLPPMCGKSVAVSNKILLEWIEESKVKD